MKFIAESSSGKIKSGDDNLEEVIIEELHRLASLALDRETGLGVWSSRSQDAVD
jgi:hypothetical protein